MTPKELLLKTADYIEANPGLYNFSMTCVPPCGSPGCVIGLAGMIAGAETGRAVSPICVDLFGIGSGKLYRKLRSENWTNDYRIAVKNIRAYAATLPDDKPEASEYSHAELMLHLMQGCEVERVLAE